MKRNNAFTLAEVLLTLVIIGVISALTVPAIKKISEERTYVSATKKAYYTLSTIVKKAIAEEGPVKLWSNTDKVDFIKKRLNVVGPVPEKYDIMMLSGATSKWGEHYKTSGVLVSDGSYWRVGPAAFSASGAFGTGVQAYVMVDINGKTPPNTVGVDVHCFWIGRDGSVYPTGGGPGANTSECAPDRNGWGCTAKIIQEGKITW